MTDTTRGAFLAHVGNLDMYREGGAYALYTKDGERLGTYSTARAASVAGYGRIAAGYKARTRATR